MTGLSADDRYLMVNPYFHMFGLKAGILACVAAGATMYPEPAFDAGRGVGPRRSGDDHRVPGRADAVPGDARLTRPRLVRLVVVARRGDGRGRHSRRADRRVRKELPFSFVVTGYGLTEAGHGVGDVG